MKNTEPTKTLLEMAKTTPLLSTRKTFTKEHWELIRAFYLNEITALQAATVLKIPRSNVYFKAGSITRYAVKMGWVKL